MRGSAGAAGLAWAALPLLLYLLVLRHFWFDAPVWDDYDAILDSALRMMDAGSPGEWIGIVVAQHNEHRIAVMRLVSRAMAALGGVDFRILVLVGNLSVLGIFALAWLEFRHAVAPPLFAAAAFLMFQWSYYEASLMGSAALPNIGVVFFSLACLFFSLRGGRGAAAACVLFGALAVGSQANGLFALPMAAAAALIAGKRPRALLFGAVAIGLWSLYFIGYARPLNHPSVFAALGDPVSAVRLFLIVIGGVEPVGAAILAVLAWLAHKRMWKAHPAAALWVAFILLSAAAATAGRVGFGVFHASRYAVYSTTLIVITFLAFCAATGPWSRPRIAGAIAVAAAASIGITWLAWPKAHEYSVRGRLLVKAVGAPADSLGRYPGIFYPNHEAGTRILRAAEQRGLYAPREQPVHSTTVRSLATIPAAAHVAGHVDGIEVAGARATFSAWTAYPAFIPGRVLSVISPGAAPLAMKADTTARDDVAMAMRAPHMLLSGYRVQLDFASEEAARAAAASLCLAVEAPGYPVTVLARANGRCTP